MADLPGLLALHLAPAGAWPALDELDPFECRLVLTALSSEPAERITAWAAPWLASIEVRPLSPSADADAAGLCRPGPGIAAKRRCCCWQAAPSDGFEGRLASAGRVAVNVLRREGQPAQAESVERTLAESFGAE